MKFIDEVKFHILLLFIAMALLILSYWATIHGQSAFGTSCMHKCWEVLSALLLLITGHGLSSPNGSTPPDAAKK